MGTIGVERLYNNQQLLHLDLEVLGIIATTIAQAVELHLLDRAHRKILRIRSALQSGDAVEKFNPVNIIGNSRAMQGVYRLIEKVSHARTTVLILGESGVGKERVASAIHYNGDRAKKPFVKFNCASLPESVVESELFGHERGAFTGALSRRAGRFEEANGGTLFLDEIGEMPLALQTRLLRVLEEREVLRVGSTIPTPVDVRVVAASLQPLDSLLATGRFRPDLFYRLAALRVELPPLRGRDQDIRLLLKHFFKPAAGDDLPLSADALQRLQHYDWPGNVRELRNLVERLRIHWAAHAHDRAQLMTLQQLMQWAPELQQRNTGTPPTTTAYTTASIGTRQRPAPADIQHALQQYAGNRDAAARHLGISRTTLWRWLQADAAK